MIRDTHLIRYNRKDFFVKFTAQLETHLIIGSRPRLLLGFKKVISVLYEVYQTKLCPTFYLVSTVYWAAVFCVSPNLNLQM